jgi:hypothetical protein
MRDEDSYNMRGTAGRKKTTKETIQNTVRKKTARRFSSNLLSKLSRRDCGTQSSRSSSWHLPADSSAR